MNEISGREDPLAFLRTQPQFQQMRQVVQQNPQLLDTVLQQIGQSNPALLQLITENQEAFVRMMNEPAGRKQKNSLNKKKDLNFGSGDVAQRQAAAAAAALGEDAGAAPVRTIQVTPQDKQAIDRVGRPLKKIILVLIVSSVEGFGFPRALGGASVLCLREEREPGC